MPSNISNDYTLLNQSASVSERSPDGEGVAASVTITYSGAGDDGRTITIIDALANSVTYELDRPSGVSPGVSPGNVLVDIEPWPDSDGSTFPALKTAIEGPSGHNGEIICVHDTVANTLTLTQNTAGTAGNTTVTFGGGYGWISGDPDELFFTGGVDAPAAITEAQFLLGTKSTINLRGQTTTSRYKVFLGEEKS